MAKLRVDIWSDIACPWCYIGKRHFEQALGKFAHKGEVDVVWRAFELDPSAPRVRDASVGYVDRLARKYGTQPAQAKVMLDRVVAAGAAAGLELRFDHIRSGNTFDAHRLLHLAHDHGRQDAMKERLMRGYLTEGQAVGQPEVLATLAGEVGLDPEAARDVLASDRYTAEVRQDEAMAHELGISGVPFFVLDGRLGVSGAQPADVLLGALDKAWTDLAPKLETFAEGATCGPDGCD
jgi:predicted DsbA family dithiol-disulfide isomerase